jgi:glucosamine-6-phosphate deaminase
MEKFIFRTTGEMAAGAADNAAEAVRDAIKARGRANIILATGASQIEMLGFLTAAEGVDWSKVTMFHLDEYIGLGPDHPASFRKYLKERFVDEVGNLKAAHFVDGNAADPKQAPRAPHQGAEGPCGECKRLGELIRKHPIDAAMIGIGENGHLAFNDPPADFQTEEPYIVVELDEKCRKQQLGEGWFETLEGVPRRAISMSIRQIMKSARLIVTVPDRRKAEAVKNALEGPVRPQCPASILQRHRRCKIFLDSESARLLSSR